MYTLREVLVLRPIRRHNNRRWPIAIPAVLVPASALETDKARGGVYQTLIVIGRHDVQQRSREPILLKQGLCCERDTW